ncbi:MAG: glutathione S-transferase family protein [bacterium]|nr:glutathione S-transferase family protein [bacterium]
MKLYHASQSRSVRPRWLLEELGVPYEVERLSLSAGDHKKPAYLKLNPNGQVPTLVDGDLALFESAAICQYLTDKYPEKGFAPPAGTPERGRYYQWIHYAMSGLEPPAVTIFLHTIMKPEAERLPQLVGPARETLVGAVGVVDAALAGREWLVGDRIGTADVMVGSTLVWCAMMGLLGDDTPHAKAYLERIAQRPAYQRAGAD